MIALLVKPPTRGWSSPKEFEGESVKFKLITTYVSFLGM